MPYARECPHSPLPSALGMWVVPRKVPCHIRCGVHSGHGWVLLERCSGACKGSSNCSMTKTRARAASAVSELSHCSNKCPVCSPPFLGTHQQPCPESAGSRQCLAAGLTLSTMNNSSCLSCSLRKRSYWASAHSA